MVWAPGRCSSNSHLSLLLSFSHLPVDGGQFSGRNPNVFQSLIVADCLTAPVPDVRHQHRGSAEDVHQRAQAGQAALDGGARQAADLHWGAQQQAGQRGQSAPPSHPHPAARQHTAIPMSLRDHAIKSTYLPV